jgi:hypothetical protein
MISFLSIEEWTPMCSRDGSKNKFTYLIGDTKFSKIYEYNNTMEQSNTTINQVQIEQKAIQAGL